MDKTSYSIRSYLKITRYLMYSIGQWPYDISISAKIFQIFWTLQHCSILIPEIIKLYECRNNADHIIESIPPIFYNTIAGIIFLNGIYQKDKMKYILEDMHKNWKFLSDIKEEKIFTSYADMGKLMSLFYLVGSYMVVILFCILPLTPIVLDYIQPLNVSREKEPLYRVQLFIDDNENYYTILMHSYFTTLIGIIPIIALDTYQATCIQHICGMFAILSKRLENTMKYEANYQKLNDKTYLEVISCANLHRKILKLIKIYNEIFRTTFGLLLLVLITLMSMTGLVTLIKWGNWKEVIRFGLFTMAETFHVLCFSYHSQDLIDHNNQLYVSLCNSGWYQASIKTRIVIMMMILQSLKPCQINCLIFPLSMENFTIIMKTSVSYFTVVKSYKY